MLIYLTVCWGSSGCLSTSCGWRSGRGVVFEMSELLIWRVSLLLLEVAAACWWGLWEHVLSDGGTAGASSASACGLCGPGSYSNMSGAAQLRLRGWMMGGLGFWRGSGCDESRAGLGHAVMPWVSVSGVCHGMDADLSDGRR